MADDDRTGEPNEQHGTDGGKKGGTTTKGQKRRKVNHACLYCRRSHMTCDEGRPCQRCIKRDIGHLCHDERKPPPPATKSTNGSSSANGGNTTPQPMIDTSTPSVADSSANPTPVQPSEGFPMQTSSSAPPSSYAGSYSPLPLTATQFAPALPQSTPQWPLFANQPFGMPGTDSALGSEFSVLSDFLQSLDNRGFQSFVPGSMMQESPQSRENMDLDPEQLSQQSPSMADYTNQIQMPSPAAIQSPVNTTTPTASTSATHNDPTEPLLPAATKTERFLLTAADQEPGTRDERLARVIHAKYEAGLLRPYNYVKGYARLSRWMDHNMSNESKKQILQPLSVLRPKFRAIAQSLTDIDLVFIEEAFERLLLDYDRVFSAMGIPACLWRRTGEIYKGNREFAELVGVDVGRLRDGKMCIYELMSEESAVNYWEKYGHVAFDPAQKAVLTSCVLRYKPTSNTVSTSSGSNGSAQSSPVWHRRGQGQDGESNGAITQSGLINCCFSFTIRRDTWGIPSVIVGNFIMH